jgi:hypothetical protein
VYSTLCTPNKRRGEAPSEKKTHRTTNEEIGEKRKPLVLYEETKNSLKRINPRLPLPPQLDSDLDALVDVLGAALVVDAELEDVTVFDLVGAAGLFVDYFVDKAAP